MTIKAIIKCDNCSISEEFDLDDVTPYFDAAVHGWVQDPEDGYRQYCPECWKKLKLNHRVD